MADPTDLHRDVLRALVARVIPASADCGVPGADDAAIFGDIAATLAAKRDVIEPLLDRLQADGFAGLPAAAQDEAIERLRATDPAAFAALIIATAQCYYRDDRVMRSIDMEPRAPFPKGYAVEEGDWSLLDVVRDGPVKWREASPPAPKDGGGAAC